MFQQKRPEAPTIDPLLQTVVTFGRNQGPLGIAVIVDGVCMAGVIGTPEPLAELLDADLVRLLDAMGASDDDRDGVTGSFTRTALPRMADDPNHVVLTSAKVQTGGDWDDVTHVMIDLRKVSAWWPLSAQPQSTVTYEKG